MGKGNILVVGNSGVGKSTLINAVLGKDVAKTGFGTQGTTRELKIYESYELPFKIVDTVGFEPGFWQEWQAVNSVKKWLKEVAANKQEKEYISVIWFCVDGTAAKLFDKALRNLANATSTFSNVPIIVVITKSYSETDRQKNMQMVKEAFAKQKKLERNLRDIIPVVAEKYEINSNTYVANYGIEELIERTNELLPEGIKAAQLDINRFQFMRKRAFAQSIVGAAAASGTVVGAVPIPIPDATILVPIEVGEIKAIAHIYGIERPGQNQGQPKQVDIFETLIEAGTVGVAAKAAINALKAIPGVNLGAAAVNAAVAGCLVAALGEAAIYIFEQIYLGKKTIFDVPWAQQIIAGKFDKSFVDKLMRALKKTEK